jgi:hypothetical protein
MPESTPEPVVVIGRPRVARPLVARLRRAGWPATQVADCDRAIAVLRHRALSAVFVCVDTIDDWSVCWRVAAAADCPVAVYTSFLAPDRRFRETAFAARVSAYIAPSCKGARLREALTRLTAGERGVELTTGGPFRVS